MICLNAPNILEFHLFADDTNLFPDTVNHQILLANLEYKGMQDVANDWFVSYLSNRRQFVSLFQRNNCDHQTIAWGIL